MIGPHLCQCILPAYASYNGQAADLFSRRGFSAGRQVGIVPLVGRLDKPALVDARHHVNELAASDLVGEIVLHVDSPGGTVAGTHDLSEAISRAAKAKRVTAVVEDLAASGGYYAICGASEIVVNATGKVGSIGIFSILVDASRAFEKMGVDVIVVRSGKYKGSGYWGAKLTSDQIQEIQGTVDELARHFIAAVARGRKMKAERVADLADGRVFIGQQGVAAGLVDRVATIEDVLRDAAKRTESLRYADLDGYDAERQFAQLADVQRQARNLSQAEAEVVVGVDYPRLAKAVALHRNREAERMEQDRRSRQMSRSYF